MLAVVENQQESSLCEVPDDGFQERALGDSSIRSAPARRLGYQAGSLVAERSTNQTPSGNLLSCALPIAMRLDEFCPRRPFRRC